MPAFDQYLIVDWSANNTAKRGADSIWIYLVDRIAGFLLCENPATRSAAMTSIGTIFDAALKAGKRLFAGFDFGFGYPSGAAQSIAGKAEWSAIWQRFEEHIEDGDDNKSNRFDVAAQLNREAFSTVSGPFWGHPAQHAGRYEGLDAKCPEYAEISGYRLVETYVPKAQPVWKLAYTGSVGSQTLLGIARLQKLRLHYGAQLSIWPFETKFAEKLTSPITVAEIYPSLLSVETKEDEVKDEAQVRTMAEAFCAWDAEDQFQPLLAAPKSLSKEQVHAVLSEEGWIVGAGHELPKRRAVYDYIRDPAEIYRQSFRIVGGEAKLDLLPTEMQPVATRLIHSCGMVDVVDDLAFSDDAARVGIQALKDGASVFCDVEMVKSGIIQRLLPNKNALLCTLNDDRVPEHATTIGNTRSAAAVDFWDDDLDGAIVVVGNAPTALFRLLERVADDGPKPALVIGIPVGFVGALESKHALADNPFGLNYITVHGRRGGSAMASSVLNALAGGLG